MSESKDIQAGVPSQPVIKPQLLSYGTFVTTDLDRARSFFGELLGLECVRCAPDRLLVRDRGTQRKGHRNGYPYWVLDVRKVDAVEHPQKVLNHWGFDLPDREAVDRAHAVLTEHKERFGLKKIMPVRVQHRSYAFYFQDYDSNWWEALTRTPGREPEKLFEDNRDLYAPDGTKL